MAITNKLKNLLTNNISDAAQALVSIKAPGKVITDDISAGWVRVGKGNIIRIQVSADTYVAFSKEDDDGTVSATTSPAIKLDAGYHYIVCAADYVRASAAATRLELLEL